MPVSNLRNVLVRAYSMDMRRNHGNVVVSEALFRRVDWDLHNLGPRNNPGAVLIDSTDALGPVATAIRKGTGFLILIRATDELLWLPTRADMSAGDYWTVECIPWVEYLRAAAVPDDDIIRAAHNPALGGNPQ
jgi:hypothetical protein